MVIYFSILYFWNGFNYDNNFIINLFKNTNYKYSNNINICDLLICGPFILENDYNFIKEKKCKKYLYITEPIEINPTYKYCYLLYQNNIFNKIIGCINNNLSMNLYKYPLYILYFNINNNYLFNNINEDIKTKDINKKFCCLISTHDTWNTRKPIYEKLKNIGHITCPSNLLNNCSNEELNNIGNIAYIKQFIFHICSENSQTNVKGYITEKIMNCCMGGAIPIYCGWFDEIDEKVFNKNRILFYDSKDEKSLSQVYKKVNELMEDKEKLKDFYQQNIFMDSAYDTIQEMNNNLINLFKI